MVRGGAQENTLATAARIHGGGWESVLVTGPALGPEGSLEPACEEAGWRVRGTRSEAPYVLWSAVHGRVMLWQVMPSRKDTGRLDRRTDVVQQGASAKRRLQLRRARPDDEDACYLTGRARLVTDAERRSALSAQFVAERAAFLQAIAPRLAALKNLPPAAMAKN